MTSSLAMPEPNLQHCCEWNRVVSVEDYTGQASRLAKGERIQVGPFLQIADVSFTLEVFPKGDADAENGNVSLYLAMSARRQKTFICQIALVKHDEAAEPLFHKWWSGVEWSP